MSKGKKTFTNLVDFAQSDRVVQFTSALMEHGGLESPKKKPLHRVSKAVRTVTGKEEEPTKASLAGQVAGLALSGARSRMQHRGHHSDYDSVLSRRKGEGGNGKPCISAGVYPN